MELMSALKKVIINLCLASGFVVIATGCSSVSKAVNPLYREPSKEAHYGERSDNALHGGVQQATSARKALESMATYQSAHSPSPDKPVIQPAVVRLMWIPDHLNSDGDLVPAHYYYLKVLSERWAVSDAFELQSQLNGPGGSSGGNLPFIVEQQR